MSFFKVDPTYLIGSAARTVVARTSDIASPWTRVDQIINVTNALSYAAKTNVLDIGSAREGQGSNYSRNIEASEWRVEQVTDALYEDITQIPRSITVQIAEMTAEKLRLLENAPAVTAVSAASGYSAATRVDFGSIEQLDRWRVAMIGQFRKGIGRDVVEPDGFVRGAFYAVVLHSATISPSEASLELQKGQLANVPLTFRAFADASIADTTKAVGWHYLESAGTIA